METLKKLKLQCKYKLFHTYLCVCIYVSVNILYYNTLSITYLTVTASLIIFEGSVALCT